MHEQQEFKQLGRSVVDIPCMQLVTIAESGKSTRIYLTPRLYLKICCFDDTVELVWMLDDRLVWVTESPPLPS